MKEVCKQCQGKGKIQTTVPLPMTVPCLRCLGTGESKPLQSDQQANGFTLLIRYVYQTISAWVRRKDQQKKERDQ